MTKGQNKILKGYSLKIESIEFQEIRIIYEGHTDSKFMIDPNNYEDYSEQFLTSDSKIDYQEGFAFKKDNKIIAKILNNR